MLACLLLLLPSQTAQLIELDLADGSLRTLYESDDNLRTQIIRPRYSSDAERIAFGLTEPLGDDTLQPQESRELLAHDDDWKRVSRIAGAARSPEVVATVSRESGGSRVLLLRQDRPGEATVILEAPEGVAMYASDLSPDGRRVAIVSTIANATDADGHPYTLDDLRP